MTSNLIEMPILTALDENGDTISGAKLYTYAAGTTTPLPLYLDQPLVNPAANPVIANSAGRMTPLWGLVGQSYKLVLKTPEEVEVWTVDNLIIQSSSGPFVLGPLRRPFKVSIPTLLFDGIELFNFVVERPILLKAQDTHNKAICRTAPTADFNCSIKVNGVEVIDVAFTAGVNEATLTGTDLNIVLAEDDIVSMEPPLVIDATASRFAISLEFEYI